MNTNSKTYKKILEEYNSKRLGRDRLISARRLEIFSKLPEYARLGESVADLTMKAAEAAIGADADTRKRISRDLGVQISDISRRQRDILTGAGYPADYLEPPFECEKCQDTGFEGDVPCGCMKRRLIAACYDNSTIKAVLEKENFTSLTYQYYNESEKAFAIRLVDELKSFISHFDTDHRSLLFYGNSGAGKTFFSNCVSKELLDLGYSVVYFTSFSLFDFMAKHTFRQKRSIESDEAEEFELFPQDIFDCDFLVIDDLGSELQSSFVSSQLFLILNERHQRGSSTLISTNLDPQRINDLYSERVMSRLLGDFNFYRFEGRDMRPLLRY